MEGQREADSTMTEESWETIGLDHQRNSVLPSVSMSVSVSVSMSMEEQYLASVMKVTAMLEGRLQDVLLERGVEESSAILTPERRADLRACVSEILDSYRSHNNYYHCFEHAVHVATSVNKLLDMLKPQLQLQLPKNSDQTAVNAQDASDSSSNSSSHEDTNNGHYHTQYQAQAAGATPTPASYSRNINGNGNGNSSSPQMTMDALAKFALVFAALIHDADHPGVPNATLIQEETDLAQIYNDRSIAEQHSLRVGFGILLQEKFAQIRNLMTPTWEDRVRFRRMVIDFVLGTDIADPVRIQLAKRKWVEVFGDTLLSPINYGQSRRNSAGQSVSTVVTTTNGVTSLRPSTTATMTGGSTVECHLTELDFSEEPSTNQSQDDSSSSPSVPRTGQRSRRSSLDNHRPIAFHLGGNTIECFPIGTNMTAEDRDSLLRGNVALEVMINVADVAHTMQNWENFTKWNKRLYEELAHAHRMRRAGSWDPAPDWYQNQITFYDLYILPLARKLYMIELFGRNDRDRFVQNATSIRRRWIIEGEAITKEMIEQESEPFL